jgi:hypothetical protein
MSGSQRGSEDVPEHGVADQLQQYENEEIHDCRVPVASRTSHSGSFGSRTVWAADREAGTRVGPVARLLGTAGRPPTLRGHDQIESSSAGTGPTGMASSVMISTVPLLPPEADVAVSKIRYVAFVVVSQPCPFRSPGSRNRCQQ